VRKQTVFISFLHLVTTATKRPRPQITWMWLWLQEVKSNRSFHVLGHQCVLTFRGH